MQTKYFKRILGGLILGLSLLGIGVVSSTTAQAQYPWPTQEQIRQRERERQRELRRQREEQARQGGWYDQYGNYHPATNQQNGYYDQYGVFHPYSNQDGYYRTDRYDRYDRDGYYNNNRRSGRFNDGYPDLGGSFDLRQTAMNAGFTDGVKAGRDDLRRNRGYNIQGHSEYQKATRDYNSGRGDRYLYQQYYRMAFEHGYADGYTGH